MINEKFAGYFGYEPAFVVKAPGRTELCGNHTDHQNGKVLAAPVDLYVKAAVSKNDSGIIHIKSEGFDPVRVELSDMSVHPEEYGTTASLIRGVAADYTEMGLSGFDAYITSDIPMGSGLSSSAAFEILIGRVCCRILELKEDWKKLALKGQYAENVYFNKPCGLMDQMACAADCVISIDFKEKGNPVVEEINVDFSEMGYSLCIINCGAGHENLTSAYADITTELSKVCSMFGARVLRDVDETEFYRRISQIRSECGDRAVLRAMHVFEENKRVSRQIDALVRKDIEEYLHLVKESGRSSWEYLQNVIPEGAKEHQEMAFSIAAAEKFLQGKGAVRVHGGGFAGTLQAYVPSDMEEAFKTDMENILGEGSCIVVHPGTKS